jgi:hypothetical protein
MRTFVSNENNGKEKAEPSFRRNGSALKNNAMTNIRKKTLGRAQSGSAIYSYLTINVLPS